MAGQPLSYLDAVPGAILIALSLSQLVLGNTSPDYLVVGQWRYYLTVAAVTIVLWLVLGYLVVHLAGRTRPLTVLLTLSAMLVLPVALAPLLGWLNAKLDDSPVTVVALRVSGYRHHGRTGLIAVRFQGANLPEIEAEKMTPFFPTPVPPEGTPFQGMHHAGALGIRWLSSLRPMTAVEAAGNWSASLKGQVPMVSETASVKQGTGGAMQANANWGSGGGSVQQTASGSKIATHNTFGGETTAESE